MGPRTEECVREGRAWLPLEVVEITARLFDATAQGARQRVLRTAQDFCEFMNHCVVIAGRRSGVEMPIS